MTEHELDYDNYLLDQYGGPCVSAGLLQPHHCGFDALLIAGEINRTPWLADPSISISEKQAHIRKRVAVEFV